MRLFPIICVTLLASCGPERVTYVPSSVPASLLAPEPGWQGVTPRTEGELVDAVEAEKTGRERANAKLRSIAEIVGSN